MCMPCSIFFARVVLLDQPGGAIVPAWCILNPPSLIETTEKASDAYPDVLSALILPGGPHAEYVLPMQAVLLVMACSYAWAVPDAQRHKTSSACSTRGKHRCNIKCQQEPVLYTIADHLENRANSVHETGHCCYCYVR